jgi:hypothetical protein
LPVLLEIILISTRCGRRESKSPCRAIPKPASVFYPAEFSPPASRPSACEIAGVIGGWIMYRIKFVLSDDRRIHPPDQGQILKMLQPLIPEKPASGFRNPVVWRRIWAHFGWIRRNSHPFALFKLILSGKHPHLTEPLLFSADNSRA